MRCLRPWLVWLVFCVPSQPFAATFSTYQYDQYSEDLTTNISGAHLSAQPGFAQGEAFGQLFRPNPEDYPIKILGLDVIWRALHREVPPAQILKFGSMPEMVRAQTKPRLTFLSTPSIC